MERRKSGRTAAPNQLYVPEMGTPHKRPRRLHKNEPQSVSAAVAEFCPRAEKVLAEMKSVKRLDELGQLIANLRGSLTMLKENATANDDGQ